jgi:Mg2+ and Co2+ transporter CorA
MLFRYEYQDGTWIDLEQPTEDELRDVAHEFSLDNRIEAELLSPTPEPLVANDSGGVLVALHFPTQDAENDAVKNQEIDFVVGGHFIITAHYEIIAPLYQLKKLFETRGLVNRDESITTDVLLEILFAHLYASVRDYTNHIASRLALVEKDMFGGRERRTVRAISTINREFLHLKSSLANQEEPLHRFLDLLARRGFFDDSFNERARHILLERARVVRLTETHHAIATELRETNAALLESRQNQIMRTLTIVTFGVELIALVLSVRWLF